MNEKVRGHPLGRRPWGGVDPSSYKSPPHSPSFSHLLVKDLSPPLELFPHGLGLARYMWHFVWKELLLPLDRWSEEVEVVRWLERVCECGYDAELRRSDFLTILRSASVRLHQPRVPTR